MLFKKLRYAKYYAGILFRNWTSKKESYAQHKEDTLIELLLGRVETFIDVGANDGVLFSNTYKFAKEGARGLCVEPSRQTFRKLWLNHLFNRRVKCLNAAVTSGGGSIYLKEDGYESILSKVLSKPSPGSYPVKSMSLEKIFKNYPYLCRADLISIDVEGHEEAVIDGVGDNALDAKIVILEVDKSDEKKILGKPALRNFSPEYSNGINLFLLNKTHDFPSISNLPEGYYLCVGK